MPDDTFVRHACGVPVLVHLLQPARRLVLKGKGGVEGKQVFGLTFTRLWARQAGQWRRPFEFPYKESNYEKSLGRNEDKT
jgi:hypothetical protein